MSQCDHPHLLHQHTKYTAPRTVCVWDAFGDYACTHTAKLQPDDPFFTVGAAGQQQAPAAGPAWEHFQSLPPTSTTSASATGAGAGAALPTLPPRKQWSRRPLSKPDVLPKPARKPRAPSPPPAARKLPAAAAAPEGFCGCDGGGAFL